MVTTGSGLGNRSKPHSSFLDLDETTDFVHISGFPNLWAIEEMLRRAPNLRTIEVIPSLRKQVTAETEALCNARGVAVTQGYHHPAASRDDGENFTPLYREELRFMQTLAEEGRRKFDELLALECTEARMAVRYFGLDGADRLPLRRIAEAFGHPENAFAEISRRVNAVLCYLDAPFAYGKNVHRFAAILRERVERLRAQQKN